MQLRVRTPAPAPAEGLRLRAAHGRALGLLAELQSREGRRRALGNRAAIALRGAAAGLQQRVVATAPGQGGFEWADQRPWVLREAAVLRSLVAALHASHGGAPGVDASNEVLGHEQRLLLVTPPLHPADSLLYARDLVRHAELCRAPGQSDNDSARHAGRRSLAQAVAVAAAVLESLCPGVVAEASGIEPGSEGDVVRALCDSFLRCRRDADKEEKEGGGEAQLRSAAASNHHHHHHEQQQDQ